MSLSPSSWPRPSPRCSVTNLLKPCLFGLLQLRSVPYPSSLSWRKGLSEIGRQWKLHSAAQKATAKPKAKSINSSVSKDKCMDEPSLIYYANGCCSVDELSRKVRQTRAGRAGRWAEEWRCSPLRFHDWRHSAATILLCISVHPKLMLALPGQHQRRITMVRLCRHFLEEICATSTSLT